MSEFFRQLLTQFRDIWQRFNPVQKAILASAVILMLAGIVVVVSLHTVNNTDSGMTTLYVNLDVSTAAEITEFLKSEGIKYDMDNNGRTILIPKNNIHEARMALARNGLPRAQ
ncbi:MAG: hypothetical protein FWC26_00805, partial [Fibromonadales bacterium]|nr:hypothetical protein [Fibromonadales bacterium]